MTATDHDPRTADRAAPDDRGAPVQAKIVIPANHPMVTVLGTGDSLLKVIERAFPAIDLHARGNEITATGDRSGIRLVQRLFDEMMLVLRTGQPLTEDAVERSIAMLRKAEEDPTSPEGSTSPSSVFTANILSNRGRSIRPKTLNQQNYVDAIDRHTIVFGIGPAGTGKTYLAMAKAVQALQAKQVTRIILTRPAVEAGERLGFLPGTLYEKIDPYLRPLYDALHDMIDPDSIPRLMAAGTIEVAPLAYMRGRTLNDAFIILDEAQNTSAEQMKMFLTRLGFNSKIVVTGDVTQIDLPGGTTSGLKIVQEILDDVEDIHFSRLSSQDVVRHKLVGRIVDAYGQYDARSQGQPQGQSQGQAARDGRARPARQPGHQSAQPRPSRHTES
ncbi:PhoH family protein [Streptacidiphilus sp. PB12-B1b]|uniref:PhoH family protein n=1 Tax=Streptacidiphilus sp. PB12-B1b TaxID=2705012 RepID=UPI0015F8372C|nr:PhoH family protein [Streptacidiphilus sp. PB12-B1b]QMU75586.1 PhoH family protein [Streptacidiphilus sp. PB12-B1b]